MLGNIMKKNVIGSAVVIVYVNLVPLIFLAWRAPDWTSRNLQGIDLFWYGSFTSFAAIPLVALYLLRRSVPITFVSSIIAATAILSHWHYNNAPSSDGHGFEWIFFTMSMPMIIGVGGIIIGVTEHMIRVKNMRLKSDANSSNEGTPSDKK